MPCPGVQNPPIQFFLQHKFFGTSLSNIEFHSSSRSEHAFSRDFIFRPITTKFNSIEKYISNFVRIVRFFVLSLKRALSQVRGHRGRSSPLSTTVYNMQHCHHFCRWLTTHALLCRVELNASLSLPKLRKKVILVRFRRASNPRPRD